MKLNEKRSHFKRNLHPDNRDKKPKYSFRRIMIFIYNKDA